MLIIEKHTRQLLFSKQKRDWKWIENLAEIIYFAKLIRSHFSKSVTVNFPRRCNYSIIASEDISLLRLPFHPGSIYSPIFDTNRLNSFYRRISLCTRVCISPFFVSVKHLSYLPEEYPSSNLEKGSRDVYIEDSLYLFLLLLLLLIELTWRRNASPIEQ